MCNTAVERGALESGSWPYVDAYLARLTAAFRNALANGQSAGEVGPDVDLDAYAAYFTTALIGVAASLRAEAPPEQVRAACAIATSTLETLG